MSTNVGEEIDTEADLSQLRPFLAKQHDSFIEMLQEPIDNAISSIVRNESYFDNPEPVKVQVTIERLENIVRIIVADHGPGISRADIREHVFSTADTTASEGILNNMGAGLKASLCWSEVSLDESRGVSSLEYPFNLLTRSESDDSIHYVEGPVTGNLRVRETDDAELWETGATELPTQDHGTRVHMTCSRSDFDDDVWPRASRIEIKIQYIREILGVRFQRLLGIEGNEMIISYRDSQSGDSGRLSVEPITPVFSDDFEQGHEEFTVEDEEGVRFDVEYKYGVLDTDAIAEQVREIDDGLYMSGTTGPLRWRYRRGNAGLDVYANGRILSIQEWPWESSVSHNRFNRFHGDIKITPQDPSNQVPTSNDKSDIDRTSRVWREIEREIKENNSPIETFERSSDDSDSSEEEEGSSGGEEACDGSEGEPSEDGSPNTSTTDEAEEEEDTPPEDEPDSSVDGTASPTSEDSPSETDTDTEEETEEPESGEGEDTEPTSGPSEGSPTEESSSDGPEDGSLDESGEAGDSPSGSDPSEETDSSVEESEESPDDTGPDDEEVSPGDELLTEITEALNSRDETEEARSDEIEGADIDVIQRTTSGETVLWLVESEEARPDAVYDLMMYQDHYKRGDTDHYSGAIIVAPGLTDDGRADFERAQEREDEHGDVYEFGYESVEDILS